MIDPQAARLIVCPPITTAGLNTPVQSGCGDRLKHALIAIAAALPRGAGIV